MLRVFAVGCLVLACGRTQPYARGHDGGGIVDGGEADAGLCPAFVGTLRITTDDEYRLFVNGVLIDDVARLWSVPQTYTVTLFTGANVIAIEGTNQWKIDGLDRAVICDLRMPNGARLNSDSRWRLSTALEPGWELPGFNDSAWKPPTLIGPHGISPWGSVLPTSSATWLWSYLPSGTAASKPTLERIWLRRAFFLGFDGRLSETQTQCP